MLAHPLAGPDSWVNYLPQLHLRFIMCVDGTIGCLWRLDNQWARSLAPLGCDPVLTNDFFTLCWFGTITETIHNFILYCLFSKTLSRDWVPSLGRASAHATA